MVDFKRGSGRELPLKAQAIVVELSDGSPVGVLVVGLIVGSLFILIADQFPLQQWARDNEKEILKKVSDAFEPVTVLRIFADTHK